eukprot:scaffold12878_cov31-Tisochrysis_lutea.AAC.2
MANTDTDKAVFFRSGEGVFFKVNACASEPLWRILRSHLTPFWGRGACTPSSTVLKGQECHVSPPAHKHAHTQVPLLSRRAAGPTNNA